MNTVTHGIDVRVLSDFNASGVDVIAWDFGGQHECYNSHHHFLGDQALHVVLLDTTTHEKDLWDVKKVRKSKSWNTLLFL